MSSQDLPEKLVVLIDTFQEKKSYKQRLLKLIEFGKQLPSCKEIHCTTNQVRGCVSNVYIFAELNDGLLSIKGDADSLMIKGLVYILTHGLSGSTPNQIAMLSSDFIQKVGLHQMMIPSRTNGFQSIFSHIQDIARDNIKRK